MGRRIYTEDGKFVWKYRFGRQPNEMCRYAENYGIGKYITEGRRDDNGNIWTDHTWVVDREQLDELENLVKKLKNGLTEKEIDRIGLKAVKKYIKSKSDEWKEVFKKEIKEIEKEGHFKSAWVCRNGKEFRPSDVFAKAVEKRISDTLDFLRMTERFVEFIEIQTDETFVFVDEY